MAAGDRYAGDGFVFKIGGLPVPEVRDLAFPLSLGKSDATRRSDSGWGRDVKTTKRLKATGKMIFEEGDTIQDTVRNALLNRTDLAIVIERPDGSSVSCNMSVDSFNEDQALEDPHAYDFEFTSEGAVTFTPASS